MLTDKSNLPTTIHQDDGYADVDPAEAGRTVVQGAILRCVDGRWRTRENVDFDGVSMLALAVKQALQRWKEQKPVETIIKQTGQPLPDLDEVNAKIPQDTWELGVDGKPRPPWQKQSILYLLDPRDAGLFTFVSSTIGARIAVENLKSKVQWMRSLRGESVVPLVKLTSAPMKTAFGSRQRPEFEVVEWRDLSASTEQTVAEPSTAEALNDAIPH
jgi:hypothetical protein